MPRDTRHEAAIEAAAKALYGQFSAGEEGGGFRLSEWILDARAICAAYDAALGGDSEITVTRVRDLIEDVVDNGRGLDAEQLAERIVADLDAARGGEAEGEQLLPEYNWKGECPMCGAPPGYPCNAAQEGRYRVHIHPERAALSQHPEPRQDQPVDRASGETEIYAGQEIGLDSGETITVPGPNRYPLTGRVGLLPYVRLRQAMAAAERASLESDGRATYQEQIEVAILDYLGRVEHPETGERKADGIEARARTMYEAECAKRVGPPATAVPWGDVQPKNRQAWLDLARSPEPLQDGGELREQVARVIAREWGIENIDDLDVAKEEMLRAADAAIALARPASLAQDGGEREPWTGKRLFDTMLHEAERARNPFGRLSTSGKAKWESLAARIEREIEGHPHQDVGPRRLTLTRREIGALLAAGNLSYQGVTLLVEEGPGSIDLTNRSEAEVERLREALAKLGDEARHALLTQEIGPQMLNAKWVLDTARAALASPDTPTQLGSEESTPNTTAQKLGPASPDDRGGER